MCDVQEKMLEFLRSIKLELERLAKQSPDIFDSTLGQASWHGTLLF